MQLQISFHDLAPSESLARYVERRAAKLEGVTDRIVRCHVALEAPHRHREHGKHYRARIDMFVPGGEIVAGSKRKEDYSHEDAYAAIDDAFDDALRVLKGHVSRHYRDAERVTNHERPRRGHVVKLWRYEGFGFLVDDESETGEEIYFHRNSVLNGGWSRIEIGSRVRYAEEMGDNGPQASTVLVAHHRGADRRLRV